MMSIVRSKLLIQQVQTQTSSHFQDGLSLTMNADYIYGISSTLYPEGYFSGSDSQYEAEDGETFGETESERNEQQQYQAMVENNNINQVQQQDTTTSSGTQDTTTSSGTQEPQQVPQQADEICPDCYEGSQDSDEPLIHTAIRHGHPQCISNQQTETDNLNVLNDDGYTPLTFALYMCTYGNTHALRDCVHKVILQGADINYQSSNEWNDYPIHVACRQGLSNHLYSFGMQENQTLDLNVVNNEGKTALHLAAGSGHFLNCVQELINRGADLYQTDNNGETALEAAQRCGYTDCQNQIEAQM